jgi:hypothetical protein
VFNLFFLFFLNIFHLLNYVTYFAIGKFSVKEFLFYMYKYKDCINRNTNMRFMNRFISSKMVKIVEIPKGASFEDEEKNG